MGGHVNNTMQRRQFQRSQEGKMSVYRLAETLEISEAGLLEYQERQIYLRTKAVVKVQWHPSQKGVWVLLGEENPIFL